MYHYDGGFGFFNFGGFGIMNLLLLVIIAFVVVYFINNNKEKIEESALDVLKKRYVKGEITKKEFEEMKKNIS